MRAALLFLCLLPPLAGAQTVNVRWVYDIAAETKLGSDAAAQATAAAQVAEANQALQSSGIPGNVANAGVSTYSSLPVGVGVGSMLTAATYDFTLAAYAQASNADVIVVLTEHPVPDSIGVAWSGVAERDALNSVMVLDVSSLKDGSFLYWLGRMMGARNQRSGGIVNDSVGTAHGYWANFGNSISDCETAYTSDATGLTGSFAGTCNAWIEGWVPPNPPGYAECSPQKWCSDYATVYQKQNYCLPNFSPCPSALYNNFRSESVTGSGNSTTCNWAVDTYAGTFHYPQLMGSGTPNAQYAFVCPTKTRLKAYSSPAVVYRGVPMGDANNNSSAVIASNVGARAAVHVRNRAKVVMGTIEVVR